LPKQKVCPGGQCKRESESEKRERVFILDEDDIYLIVDC
jgi:hypothetical protein